MSQAKEEDKVELKALVLADSFDELFQPLSLNKPRCLLPLCNVPMIEYTLEVLALSGVVETIILCKAHADKLVQYIKQSQWTRGHMQMKVVVRTVRQATTIGDALRAADEFSATISDFILCTGIVMSNINLSRLVAAHRANKKRDPNHIMTMLLQEATGSHRRHDLCDESVYFIEPGTSRLLALNSHPSVAHVRSTVIQSTVLTEHAEVEVRADLTDTNISICSPDVLALFTENFDYHIMRRDFIHGILESDILSKTIYAHVLEGTSALEGKELDLLAGEGLAFVGHSGYAASVTDTAAYDAISRDMIGRWTYPLCPDNNPSTGAEYSYHRGAVYKASSVRLDRQSRVEHHVILGANTHVANFSCISDSVLGQQCLIGEQSMVRGSYLFAGVKVGQNVAIEQSILGERVTVLDNVTIGRGCLIGDDVTIGPNITIPPFTRIARRPMRLSMDSPESMQDELDSEDEDEETGWTEANAAAEHDVGSGSAEADAQEQFDAQAVGAKGIGYVWADSTAENAGFDSDYDDEDNMELQLQRLHTIGSTVADANHAESDHDYDSHDEETNAHGLEDIKLTPQEEFERELHLTIKRACDEDLSPSKSALEIKSLRMSYNKEQDDMRAGVMQEVLRTIDIGSMAESAKRVMYKWAPVIEEYISDGRDQLDLMGILERYCALEDEIDDALRSRLFVRLVYLVYQLDIVEDVAIVAWFNRAEKKPAGEVHPELLRALQPVVDGLNESDDESEEESESD
ncbi:translation initiation factor eIF-2B epsilon subunit, GEF [Coemansia sp. RSA 989]|nr:translation initiation factor eIF-2B epsilon subunit, GEF [Coemansia sp. RSA 989]KAJ2632622.1 translation initiation factor eIF-2B epsilon subunit, GEF [Coemansia sp. RSA 1290]KAJ2653901.1 translation initiation factor eIF-2B epsilon subunit, GEF [Coemansia sp. RSA 1250]